MESGAILSKLSDVLHAVAQALLVPDILLLLGFICYALFCIGSIIMEFIKEHRNYKVEIPKFLAALMSANDTELPGVIKNSGLLNRQKQALLTVYDYRMLPGDALVALIRKLVNTEETHYARITARNNTAAKIAPMAGLMGTLIPLGPGVAALGTGDTSTLSSSLLIAFDTTVAGLIVAVICLAIGKIRSTWYNDYMTTLDSGMATMLQKIETMREKGQIKEQAPTNYAFLFEEGLKKEKATRKESRGKDASANAAAQGAQAAQSTTAPTGNAAAAARSGAQAGQAPTAQARPTTAAGTTPTTSASPAGAQVARPGQTAPGYSPAAATRPATNAQAVPGATTAPRPGAPGQQRPVSQQAAQTTGRIGTVGAQQNPQATGQVGNASYINQLAAQAQAEARAQAQARQAQSGTTQQGRTQGQAGRGAGQDTSGQSPWSPASNRR